MTERTRPGGTLANIGGTLAIELGTQVKPGVHRVYVDLFLQVTRANLGDIASDVNQMEEIKTAHPENTGLRVDLWASEGDDIVHILEEIEPKIMALAKRREAEASNPAVFEYLDCPNRFIRPISKKTYQVRLGWIPTGIMTSKIVEHLKVDISAINPVNPKTIKSQGVVKITFNLRDPELDKSSRSSMIKKVSNKLRNRLVTELEARL